MPSVMWYSTGSSQLEKLQPKRPLQNALARAVSAAGSSKWTSLPAIALLSKGCPGPYSAARGERRRDRDVGAVIRVDRRDGPAVRAGLAPAVEERRKEVCLPSRPVRRALLGVHD